MLITTLLTTFGSIDFPNNFCQEIMAILGTRIRKCLTFYALPGLEMRKLFKERKLFKGGNYMRKYGILLLLAT